MTSGVCRNCGDAFTDSWLANYCSINCRRVERGGPDMRTFSVQRPPPRERLPACLTCGAELRGRRWKYCSSACSPYRQRPVEPAPVTFDPRPCANCGRDIGARSSRTLYCSERCMRAVRQPMRLVKDPVAREYAFVLAGDVCSYCGGPSEAVDHVKPLARGGDTGWDNLTAACRACNSSKNARPLLRFLAARGARKRTEGP